jgi:hypothetical protein
MMAANGLSEQQLQLLKLNSVPASKFDEYCLASISLFNTVSNLSRSDGAAIMRSILTAK